MKISLTGSRSCARKSGFAVLVIMVLLACIAMLLYSNSKTLHLLSQELKLIEKKQQARYGRTGAAQAPEKAAAPVERR